jgi:hypothetical protein
MFTVGGEVFRFDGLGLLLSTGGWLLYWRKGLREGLCGVCLSGV